MLPPGWQSKPESRRCFRWAKGECTYGQKCKFVHDEKPEATIEGNKADADQPVASSGSAEQARSEEPYNLEEMAWLAARSTLAHVHIVCPQGWNLAENTPASKVPWCKFNQAADKAMIKGASTAWRGIQGGRESGRQVCDRCLCKLGEAGRKRVECTLAEYQLR